MRIAIIADIHGNLPALEAVLADIKRRAVDRTINLGDCVSGPLWPREVCDLLIAREDLTIRGNHDRWVSGSNPGRMGASDQYAFSQLNQDHRSWLGALPASASGDHGILACHGTPTCDNQYLVEEASGGRLVRAKPAAIQKRLGGVQARVILCGHSHQQHLIQIPDCPVILNPGSVGCPSYDDPGNDPHVSESGSPHARYAILDIDDDHVSAEMIAISYDWQSAADRAERNGRPEWAHGLRTGWFVTFRSHSDVQSESAHVRAPPTLMPKWRVKLGFCSGIERCAAFRGRRCVSTHVSALGGPDASLWAYCVPA